MPLHNEGDILIDNLCAVNTKSVDVACRLVIADNCEIDIDFTHLFELIFIIKHDNIKFFPHIIINMSDIVKSVTFTVHKTDSSKNRYKAIIDDDIYTDFNYYIDKIIDIHKPDEKIDIYAEIYTKSYNDEDTYTLFQIFKKIDDNVNNKYGLDKFSYYEFINNKLDYEKDRIILQRETEFINDSFKKNTEKIIQYVYSGKFDDGLKNKLVYENIPEFNELRNKYKTKCDELQKYINKNKITSETDLDDEHKELYSDITVDIPAEIEKLNLDKVEMIYKPYSPQYYEEPQSEPQPTEPASPAQPSPFSPPTSPTNNSGLPLTNLGNAPNVIKSKLMGYLKLAGVIALIAVIVAVILFFSIKK